MASAPNSTEMQSAQIFRFPLRLRAESPLDQRFPSAGHALAIAVREILSDRELRRLGDKLTFHKVCGDQSSAAALDLMAECA
jgi:hypothetical protein